MYYIGTSGYSYPDWRGAFYPSGLSKNDYLAYYAEHFQTLELNSSYYSLPATSLIRNLVTRTPDKFQVVVKAHRSITHEREGELAACLGAFREAVEPLAERGKLAAVLLQFPFSFHYGDPQLEFLEHLLERLSAFSTVIEFRNGRWLNKSVLEWLKSRKVALCCVDEPRLPGLVPPEVALTSDKIGYVRFHGRNAEKWWEHEAAWERYDYLYRMDELEEWREGIEFLGQKAERTFIFFNNHFRGQAARNAEDMQEMLGLPRKSGGGQQQSLF